MSYEKQNFVKGQILKADHLNHMEDGIAAAAVGVQGPKGDKGDPGPQGLQGPKGDAGAKGDKGDSGDGISETAKNLLLTLFENAAYKTIDIKTTLDALRVEWGETIETAQLIYSLPGETALTQGLDTGLKLLEHASTETPQYTILVDAKAGDDFNANTWPAFLHCLTETGDTGNLPGFNSTSSPLNNKTEFAYYNYGGVTLSDSIEHFKTRTRYAVQIDGRKYRGGSTYCPLTEWKTTNGTIIDVPQTFLIGAAQSADGSKKQQFWSGTLYQCKVYKGLLSDDKVNDYIEKGW